MSGISHQLQQSAGQQRREIESVGARHLASVARFLASWHENDVEDDGERAFRTLDPSRIQRQLEWRLVRNPARGSDSDLGYYVRNEGGEIIGTILTFPARFLLGDRALAGLCSSCFFVRPEARLEAFLIFKKYLTAPRYDFYFGTTCSSYSGKLWQKLRGLPVPGSQFEFILPFRTGTLLEALADSKRLHRNWGTLARIIGYGTDTLRTELIKKPRRLTSQKTADWEHLASLSKRHRRAELLTTERSVEFLMWRYEWCTAIPPHQVYSFKDSQGNEGWFSLGRVARGRRGQVRGAILLDCVWPREKIKLLDIVTLAADICSSECDALFLSARPGIQYANLRQMTIRRRLDGPQSFTLAANSSNAIDSNIFDFVPADGDSID